MSRRLIWILAIGIISAGIIYSSIKFNNKESTNMKPEETAVQETGIIPRDVLFGNPDRAMARVSPDGKKLAYLSNKNNVLNIMVADVTKPQEAKFVTNDTDRGIRSFFWPYDSNYIIYLQDRGGDENWQVHVVNLETLDDTTYTPEGANAYLAFISPNSPEEVIIAHNQRDPKFHDYFKLNIKTGELHLLLSNQQGFSSVTFNRDFTPKIATKTAEGNTILYKSKASEDGIVWEEFDNIPFEDSTTTNILTLDANSEYYYMLDSRERNLAALVKVNLETGAREVLAEPSKGELSDILFEPETLKPLAYSEDYLRSTWSIHDESVKNDFDKLKSQLQGEISITSQSYDNKLWTCAETKSDSAISFYLYDRSTGELAHLFKNRDILDKYKLSKMEEIIIKSRDGLELPSYLTKAYNASDISSPLVLVVHGGPWARDHYDYNPTAQWLSNRGYNVLQVNFRGSNGFGKNFLNAGDKQWGAKMHDDLLDAVDWAIKNNIADKNNICIYGGSYGGYASLWAATNSSDVFKCAVDIVGPSNLETLLSTFPAYWESFMQIIYKRLADPKTEEGKAFLKERSPLTYVDNIKIPLLIAQGEKDPRVKQAESEQIVEAMKSKNIPYQYVLFKDEGHGFAKPENRIAFYMISEWFLHKNLGGRYEPASNELNKSSIVPEHIKAIKEEMHIQ